MNDALTHTAPEVNLRLVILSKMDFFGTQLPEKCSTEHNSWQFMPPAIFSPAHP